MDVKTEKNRMRAQMRQKMKALSASYCRQADAAIWKHVLSLPSYEKAHTICAYVGMKDEINTIPLILHMLADGKQVGVPLCTGKGVMEMRAIHGLDDLQRGTWNIWEPKAYTKLLRPEDIDMGLIPCVSGNVRGQRLGYGGGFYDRYLEGTSFLRVLLCRNAMMRAQIPTELHDATMDILVSENGAVRCK